MEETLSHLSRGWGRTISLEGETPATWLSIYHVVTPRIKPEVSADPGSSRDISPRSAFEVFDVARIEQN
jgi:hypothetical protein